MVRRLLLSTAAVAAMIGSAAAADLPSRRPPPPVAYVPPVPIFTWTGFYVGVNAGGAFPLNNNSSAINNAVFFGGAAPLAGSFGGFVATNNGGNNGRFLVGGQAGVNWQVNQFVLGIEGDGQALLGGNNNNFGLFPNNGNNTGFLGTVRGRGGIAFDRFLVYGTGGVAFGGNNDRANTFLGTVGGVPTIFTANTTAGTRVGYAVGAGVEYAFFNNWSIKVEYLFVDLGRNNRTFFDPVTGAGFFINHREQDHVVRAGLNYRFDWFGGAPAPVVARY
jgi:outer membrane immunogenic protein